MRALNDILRDYLSTLSAEQRQRHTPACAFALKQFDINVRALVVQAAGMGSVKYATWVHAGAAELTRVDTPKYDRICEFFLRDVIAEREHKLASDGVLPELSTEQTEALKLAKAAFPDEF